MALACVKQLYLSGLNKLLMFMAAYGPFQVVSSNSLKTDKMVIKADFDASWIGMFEIIVLTSLAARASISYQRFAVRVYHFSVEYSRNGNR